MMLARRSAGSVDRRWLIEDHEPAARSVWRAGLLPTRVEAAIAELEECCACPRNCHVNRLEGRAKVCNTGRHAIVSSAFPHFGEEDCLRGWNGSGTIFFGMCNLRCVFCQNWDISQQRAGRECTALEIAGMALKLQARGCHNINFVTPEHVAPQVVEAIAEAIPRGLALPVVYNTSAYDSLASLRLLDGLVDVYMPDFKFWTYDSSRRLLKAKDYPARARDAIREMHRQVGDLRFGPDGLARRGLLVRHLVMPGRTAEAGAIFRWLAGQISPHTYVNIMDQYRPVFQVGAARSKGKYDDIGRCPTGPEMAKARALAEAAGLYRIDARG